MNSPNLRVKEAKKSLRHRIKDEFVQAALLTLYFAIWFCAIAFFSFAPLREDAIPITPKRNQDRNAILIFLIQHLKSFISPANRLR